MNDFFCMQHAACIALKQCNYFFSKKIPYCNSATFEILVEKKQGYYNEIHLFIDVQKILYILVLQRLSLIFVSVVLITASASTLLKSKKKMAQTFLFSSLLMNFSVNFCPLSLINRCVFGCQLEQINDSSKVQLSFTSL